MAIEYLQSGMRYHAKMIELPLADSGKMPKDFQRGSNQVLSDVAER